MQTQPTETAEFEFEMLHPGFVRGLICEIGSEAGVSALYWLGGIYFYDKNTGSHAMIEQHMQDARRGRISVQTQRGQAQLLLDRLSEWIERRSGRHGLSTTRIGGGTSRRISVEDASPGPPDLCRTTSCPHHPVPCRSRRLSISSPLRGGTTSRRRDASAAPLSIGSAPKRQHARIRILRDNEILRFGERITPFMRRIGKGDRVSSS